MSKKRGPGRPKSSATLETQMMRKLFMARFKKRADRYFKAADALALGVVVYEGNDEEGKPIVYKRPPDGQMVRYIIDQGIGKAPISIEGDFQTETSYIIKRAGDALPVDDELGAEISAAIEAEGEED